MTHIELLKKALELYESSEDLRLKAFNDRNFREFDNLEYVTMYLDKMVDGLAKLLDLIPENCD